MEQDRQARGQEPEWAAVAEEDQEAGVQARAEVACAPNVGQKQSIR